LEASDHDSQKEAQPAPRSRVCVLIPTLPLNGVYLSTFEQKSNPFHFNLLLLGPV